MKTLRAIIILVAVAAAIILAVRPFQDSDWANVVRKESKEHKASPGSTKKSDEATESSDTGGPKRRKIPNGLRYVLPFVKEAVMMGVPALITFGFRALLRRRNRNPTPSAIE